VYKNSIKHFLPRIGDHPEVTLQCVTTNWDPSAKNHVGEDVDTPVDFPQNLLPKYKEWN
jgi:hypothetical protein